MSTSTSSHHGPVYFWKEYDETHSFLSQWYPALFTAPSPIPDNPQMTFSTAEQYMMYHKAILFGDIETAEKIMIATNPKKQKALGREVKGFNEELWNQHREKIVEEGNLHKFCHPVEESILKKSLLETGDRKLVEASPRDRIWGVGYNAKNAGANRASWGQNLLGKALMRVRDRVRKEESEE